MTRRWLRGLAAAAAGLVAAVAWPAKAQVVPETVSPSSVQTLRVTRDPALWPFAADSPWNRGVGRGAQFAPPSDARTASLVRGDIYPWVNADEYSMPVYRASLADPTATVHDDRNPNPDVTYRIPTAATPAAGTDEDMHVVDPTDRWVDESWSMRRRAPAYWLTGFHQRVDLLGTGMDNGVRAASVSAIGGLIRQWELDQGAIRHALALAVDVRQLRKGPVWPAKTEDWANGDYAGGVPMGTFAAIPPGVDVTRLGLTRDGVLLALALQRYGAYVVDATYGAFTFFAEPTLHHDEVEAMRADVGKIRSLLRVVTNNSRSSVNGGGVYPEPPPPPFG